MNAQNIECNLLQVDDGQFSECLAVATLILVDGNYVVKKIENEFGCVMSSMRIDASEWWIPYTRAELLVVETDQEISCVEWRLIVGGKSIKVYINSRVYGHSRTRIKSEKIVSYKSPLMIEKALIQCK